MAKKTLEASVDEVVEPMPAPPPPVRPTWIKPIKEPGPVIEFNTDDSDGVKRSHKIAFIARWPKANTRIVIHTTSAEIYIAWFADHTLSCELRGVNGETYTSFDQLSDLDAFDEGFEMTLAQALGKAITEIQLSPKATFKLPLTARDGHLNSGN